MTLRLNAAQSLHSPLSRVEDQSVCRCLGLICFTRLCRKSCRMFFCVMTEMETIGKRLLRRGKRRRETGVKTDRRFSDSMH